MSHPPPPPVQKKRKAKGPPPQIPPARGRGLGTAGETGAPKVDGTGLLGTGDSEAALALYAGPAGQHVGGGDRPGTGAGDGGKGRDATHHFGLRNLAPSSDIRAGRRSELVCPFGRPKAPPKQNKMQHRPAAHLSGWVGVGGVPSNRCPGPMARRSPAARRWGETPGLWAHGTLRMGCVAAAAAGNAPAGSGTEQEERNEEQVGGPPQDPEALRLGGPTIPQGRVLR